MTRQRQRLNERCMRSLNRACQILSTLSKSITSLCQRLTRTESKAKPVKFMLIRTKRKG